MMQEFCYVFYSCMMGNLAQSDLRPTCISYALKVPYCQTPCSIHNIAGHIRVYLALCFEPAAKTNALPGLLNVTPMHNSELLILGDHLDY